MCDERERLLDYLYDVCDAEERRRVDSHLTTCESCRQEISDLRAVRLDLQAWQVPDHGSVWRPFAPTRATSWWREVPAWGLAAAAAVMFLVGLGGGLVAHAVAPVQTVQAPAQLTPLLQPAPVLTSADTAAMEQRILASLQSRIESAQPVAAHTQPAGTAIVLSPLLREQLAGQMRSLIAESENRQRQALNSAVLRVLSDSQRTYLRQADFRTFNRDLQQSMQVAVTQALMQQGGKQ